MKAFREIAAAVMVLAACSGAVAEEAPLSAGKPSGTQKAILVGPTFAIVLTFAGVIAATAFFVSLDNRKGVTTVTTTTGTGT